MQRATVSPRTAPPTSPPPSSDPAGSAVATAATTTSIPQRPNDEDVALLAFAQSFELTARDVYQAALDDGLADDDLAPVFTTVRENHEEYGNLLSGLLGVDAPQQRDDALFDELVSAFRGGDPTAVAEAGLALESTAVATHTELLGRLRGRDGIAAISSIVTVEARHCTVLADAAGRGDDLDALLITDAEPLAPPAGASGLIRG